MSTDVAPTNTRPSSPLSPAQHKRKNGYGRHNRCSPNCTAAEPAYGFLRVVIGRASRIGLRRMTENNVLGLEPTSDFEAVRESQKQRLSTRPDIQNRRSRSWSYNNDGQPPNAEGQPKLLKFDRRLFSYTPPLPASPKDEHVEYFSRPRTGSDIGTSSKSKFSSMSDFSFRPLDPGPASTLLRRVNNDLNLEYRIHEGAGLRDDPKMGQSRKMSTYHFAEKGAGQKISPTTNRNGISHTKQIKAPRPASIASSSIYPEPPLDNEESIAFLSYLDPQLAAAVRHRLEKPTSNKSVRTQTRRKNETVSESEWSFDQLLAQCITSELEELFSHDEYHVEGNTGETRIVEYGCAKDTPHASLRDVIRSVQSSRSTSRKDSIISIIHQCDNTADIRLLQTALQTHPSSYLKPNADASDNVFPSFVFTPFAARAFPSHSVDFGLGGADLSTINSEHKFRHVPHQNDTVPVTPHQKQENIAERELRLWLKSRAKELKPGAVLIIHFVIQTTSNTLDFYSPSPPLASPVNLSISLPGSPIVASKGLPESTRAPSVDLRPDRIPHGFLHAVSKNLGPAIQRLVTLGHVRPSVAPLLLDVPFLPRTLSAARKTFSDLADWEVVLPTLSQKETSPPESIQPSHSVEERKAWSEAGVRIHRLRHPAWTAYRDGQIDRSAYAQRVSTYCRSVYESHLKRVLREKGKMDVGQSESIVQELFSMLVEKCEMGGLDNLELDVGVVVLKRAPL